jgi:hypothetical protein
VPDGAIHMPHVQYAIDVQRGTIQRSSRLSGRTYRDREAADDQWLLAPAGARFAVYVYCSRGLHLSLCVRTACSGGSEVISRDHPLITAADCEPRTAGGFQQSSPPASLHSCSIRATRRHISFRPCTTSTRGVACTRSPGLISTTDETQVGVCKLTDRLVLQDERSLVYLLVVPLHGCTAFLKVASVSRSTTTPLRSALTKCRPSEENAPEGVLTLWSRV